MTNATSTTASGIVEDPHSGVNGGRVIPQSRRADGSVRKEKKVKPGFTPAEDIARFVPSRVRQARAAEEAEQRARESTVSTNACRTTLGDAKSVKQTDRGGVDTTAKDGAKQPVRTDREIARVNAKPTKTSSSRTEPERERRKPVETRIPDAWDDDESDKEGGEKTDESTLIKSATVEKMADEIAKMTLGMQDR